MDAAYLFGEARREVGLSGNHGSLRPSEVRCSDVHRVEPEGERKHRSVPHMTKCAFFPRSNRGLLLLGGGERACEKASHEGKGRLEAQVVLERVFYSFFVIKLY